MMTIHMVLNVVKLLTYFPTKAGFSSHRSPRMIMASKLLNYKRDLALEFGTYCQVHAHHTPRNSIKACTEGGVCLGPIGNEQGGFKFMSQQSGHKFMAHKWTQLPIPSEVIKRVNYLGKDQPKDLVFFDCSGVQIKDDNNAPIAGVDSDDPEKEIEDDHDITNKLAEIAKQDEADHAIKEAGGKVVELQKVQQFDIPTVDQDGAPDTENIEDAQPSQPVEIPEVRRSNQNKTKTMFYKPTMKGKSYHVDRYVPTNARERTQGGSHGYDTTLDESRIKSVGRPSQVCRQRGNETVAHAQHVPAQGIETVLPRKKRKDY
jgi:hypothetical protein